MQIWLALIAVGAVIAATGCAHTRPEASETKLIVTFQGEERQIDRLLSSLPEGSKHKTTSGVEEGKSAGDSTSNADSEDDKEGPSCGGGGDDTDDGSADSADDDDSGDMDDASGDDGDDSAGDADSSDSDTTDAKLWTSGPRHHGERGGHRHHRGRKGRGGHPKPSAPRAP